MYNPERLNKMAETVEELMLECDYLDGEDDEDVFEFSLYGIIVLLHHAKERIENLAEVYQDLYDPLD